MVRAIFAGSFDPLTHGHIDLIKRSFTICDHLIIAIGINSAKKTLFTEQERIDMIEEEMRFQDRQGHNIEGRWSIKTFSGLLVDFANHMESKLLIRGVRTATDYEYEANLASINRAMAPKIETILLTTRPEMAMISSSAVKEIAKYGGTFGMMVPGKIARRVKEKFATGLTP